MKNMKIVIFISLKPARVESMSRIKLMIKQSVKVIDHYNVDVHNTLAGPIRIDFLDGVARGSGRSFWGGPAECAGPLGGI